MLIHQRRGSVSEGGERPQRHLYNTSVRENDTAPAASKSIPRAPANQRTERRISARQMWLLCSSCVRDRQHAHELAICVRVHIARTGTQPDPSSRSLNPALPSGAGRLRLHARRGPPVRPSRTHLACRIPDFELHDRIAQLDGLREEGGCRGAESTTSKRMQKKREGEDWTQQRMVLVRRVGSHEQAAHARADHPRSSVHCQLWTHLRWCSPGTQRTVGRDSDSSSDSG